MNIGLSVILDELRAYRPTVESRDENCVEVMFCKASDIAVVDAQKSPNPNECADKIVFLLHGSKDDITDSAKVVVTLDAEDLTDRQLRGKLLGIKTKYDLWSCRLLEAVAKRASLSEFVRIGAEVFPCPVFLENNLGQRIAETGCNAFAFADSDACENVTVFPVNYERKRFVTFHLLQKKAGTTQGQIFLAHYFTAVLEYYFSVLHAKGMESEDSTSLVRQVINGIEKDRNAVEFRLGKYGWKTSDSFFVMTSDVSAADKAKYFNLFLIELRELVPRLMSCFDRGKAYVIVNTETGKHGTLLPQISVLAEKYETPVGVSDAFGDFMLLKKYCRQASYALGKADAGTLCMFKQVQGEFLNDYLLASLTEYGDIIHPKLECLASVSDGDGLQYVKTLYTFLLCGSNASAAARRLFIDRNTLLYRLKKLGGIIDIDMIKWEPSESERLHFLISCYLMLKK